MSHPVKVGMRHLVYYYPDLPGCIKDNPIRIESFDNRDRFYKSFPKPLSIRNSTVGGLISADGILFVMTVAHVFLGSSEADDLDSCSEMEFFLEDEDESNESVDYMESVEITNCGKHISCTSLSRKSLLLFSGSSSPLEAQSSDST